MKIILKTVLWILGISLFLVIQGIILIYVYEDDIKDIAVKKLNENLNTPISVGHISFSVFEHFPYASIRFPDVEMKEGFAGSQENLVVAKEVSLLFNVWDLYKKQYKIKKLYLKDAGIYIKLDSLGRPNYAVWKPGTGSSGQFELSIEEVIFKNTSVYFLDRQDYKSVAVELKDARASGMFSEKTFDLQLDGSVRINSVLFGKVNYLREKDADIKALLHIDLLTNTYEFKKADLDLKDIRLSATGMLRYSENDKRVDLAVKGDKMTIQSFISLIPNQYQSYFKDYNSKGDFYFNTTVKGELANPHIVLSAGINKGTIEVKNKKFGNRKFENVNVQFSYTNGAKRSNATSKITVPVFNAVLEGDELSGRFSYENFDNPYIDLYIKTATSFTKLQSFLQTDHVVFSSGKFRIDAGFKGYLKEFKSSSGIDRIESEGNIQLEDVAFTAQNSPLKFNSFNGDFVFRKNDLRINSLSGNAGGSDIKLTGYFRNLIAFFLLPDQDLEIDANLTSRQLILDQLLTTNAGNDPGGDYSLKINPKLICTIRSNVKLLKFEKFSAENISGNLTIRNQQLQSDYLSFNAVGGQIYSKININAEKPNAIIVEVDANMQKVDMRRLFYEFDNFGLSILKDENVKGQVTSVLYARSVWNQKLQSDTKQFYAKGSVLVENGELINFQPMLALSRFIDVNELKNLRFSTLENTIEVKDEVIRIPMMDIKSNALNLSLSGTHDFNNQIDYRLKLLLSDILKKRSKRLGDEQFGDIEDDGIRTTLYIRMYGDAAAPKFTLDKENIKKKIADDLRQERKEVKDVLKQEINSWFKKDQEFQEAINEDANDWERDIPRQNTAPKEPKVNPKTDTTGRKKSSLQKLKDKLKEPVTNDADHE